MRAAATKIVTEYVHNPAGVVEDTPFGRPGVVSLDDDGDGVPGGTEVVDEGGVVVVEMGAGGDAPGDMGAESGEISGVVAGEEAVGV